MKNSNKANNKNNNGFLPSSLKFISSCIKTASSGVRSAAASISSDTQGGIRDQGKQVLWASFDKLQLGPSSFRNVLLLGYSNGFQVIDVEDASGVTELVSRWDDPVTCLRMPPLPAKAEGCEGFRAAHPLVLVACEVSETPPVGVNGRDGVVRDSSNEHQAGSFAFSPTVVRFYSLKCHDYVHVLKFRSAVFMVRCSPQVVAVGLATQIYCFDALTLENKFSVLTYPVPQVQGGIMDPGYGPMAVGPRWIAYASDNPLVSNTGRLSPQSLTPPMGVSPSTSPGNGNLVARYAMESSKQLATGLMSLGDMGYKTLSRYCQDFVADGSSSPVSPNSSWKGRITPHSAEADIAGMVVVRDFVTRAVISQFRAHTSPISALCFDPSGTLLVTASIHGHNINIFRIVPSAVPGGSGAKSFKWSSSHVHLYKLHRGITSAVIQDICFSSYSQWVAIISSRGTCHVFALSPFGGENVLQVQNSDIDGPVLLPVSSLPWWSELSFQSTKTLSLSESPPPPPVTLSVVARIKSNHSGWLNTVSSAASSVSGKASIPSGAVAAVFHNCVPQDSHLKKSNALEHLLAYTPCGHVVQYKLVSSVGAEPSEGTPRIGLGSSVQTPSDEELRVKTESIQWWDVCRRTDWQEREELVPGLAHSSHEKAEVVMDTSYCEEDNETGNNVRSNMDLVKSHEQSRLYLANAEVQISPWRTPLWLKSKVYFHAMDGTGADEQNVAEDQSSGETAIEKGLSHEIEIRRKDLLPVFEHFHGIADWSGRGLRRERSTMSTGSTVPAVLQPISNANSDIGSLANLYISPSQHPPEKFVGLRRGVSGLASPMSLSPAEDSSSVHSESLTNNSPSNIGNEGQSSSSASALTNASSSSNRSDLSANMIIDEGMVNESPDFDQIFLEDHCKSKSSKVVATNASPRELENLDNQEDDDDMLGGVFSFSEEG
ncbi:Autophagy-related protein 18h [Linum perenne]